MFKGFIFWDGGGGGRGLDYVSVAYSGSEGGIFCRDG